MCSQGLMMLPFPARMCQSIYGRTQEGKRGVLNGLLTKTSLISTLLDSIKIRRPAFADVSLYLVREGCESHSQQAPSPTPESYLIHPFNKKVPLFREDT